MGWNIVSCPEVGEWVAERVGGRYNASDSQAIGLVRQDKIIAGVIFERYNGASMWVHIAAEGRLTPNFVKAVCTYAFIDCDCEKVIGTVTSGNVKAIKFDKNLGFTEEARIRDAAPDGDIIIYTLSKSNCRFINHGR
jgi:RimJ/RimL family protein N-acetyltransferase